MRTLVEQPPPVTFHLCYRSRRASSSSTSECPEPLCLVEGGYLEASEGGIGQCPSERMSDGDEARSDEGGNVVSCCVADPTRKSEDAGSGNVMRIAFYAPLADGQ